MEQVLQLIKTNSYSFVRYYIDYFLRYFLLQQLNSNISLPVRARILHGMIDPIMYATEDPVTIRS